ncbi:hypothetical protein CISIN_1g031370mg [Citrus sinensis]|uniref:Ataxin-2 C-terminal domain-containing protein n=2 Tax=Citrus sinensis TaxID=2711 RepID=A0A067GUF5_CITSI|nr:hypothetical protein CISIN_1g031370mg [Citrus sinensis]
MAMVDDRRSRLNPNAPIFIPNAAFGEVEDFSPEWWDLVKTSPLFRDYWLSQHQEDDFTSSFDDYDYSDLDEFPDIVGADLSVESKEKNLSDFEKGRVLLDGLHWEWSGCKGFVKELEFIKTFEGARAEVSSGICQVLWEEAG